MALHIKVVNSRETKPEKNKCSAACTCPAKQLTKGALKTMETALLEVPSMRSLWCFLWARLPHSGHPKINVILIMLRLRRKAECSRTLTPSRGNSLPPYWRSECNRQFRGTIDATHALKPFFYCISQKALPFWIWMFSAEWFVLKIRQNQTY